MEALQPWPNHGGNSQNGVKHQQYHINLTNILITDIQYIASDLILSTTRMIFCFRYLYEFLYVWLVSALSRADAMLLEQDGYETNKTGKSGRSSKNRNRNKKKHRPYGKEITYNQALQHLCGGYYKVNKLI